MITVLMHRHQANYIDDDLKRLPVTWHPGKLLISMRITKFQAFYIHDVPEKYRGSEIIPRGKII
jgi:hypothetical protein